MRGARGLILAKSALFLAMGTTAGATEARYWNREIAIRDIRMLEANADAIFIADARYRSRRMDAQLRYVAPVAGKMPPKTAAGYAYTNNSIDDGTVIVFAERAGRKHFPYQFWRWGEWNMTYLYPSEILDPEFAARLRKTADNLRSEAGR